ncbi:MAG: hypothetical protein ACRCZF_02670, partial [Gemmataceae bacterium]
FYSPTQDLLILSPERLDANSSSFNRMAQSQYQIGWNREDLLKGKFPKGRAPVEIARMMTLALVDKTLEEEGDHAAISREGSRQLYLASGIVPRNVMLPFWLEDGLASFFHKPKGPVYTRASNGTPLMTVGLTAGYGSPNFVQHRIFKDLVTSKELNPAPDTLLRNVILDKYFEAVREGEDIDPPPVPANRSASNTPSGPSVGGPQGNPMAPPPAGPRMSAPGAPGAPDAPPPGGGLDDNGPRGSEGGLGRPNDNGDDADAAKRRLKMKLERKSHATAWALTYYLNRYKLPGMIKFHAEIKRMPRDLRLNEDLVLMTFCRCFNLTNPERTQIDKAAFQQFAIAWLDTMRNAPPYGLDIALDSVTADPGAGGGGPGGNIPGAPGGGAAPGAPGGPGAGGGGAPGGPGGPGGSG